MAELRILPPARKFFKKIKDKKLKALYKEAIEKILKNPLIGEDKHGDLKGIKGYDIYYNRTNYELAYTLERIKNANGDLEIVVVILAGTRENFYDSLKQYWL